MDNYDTDPIINVVTSFTTDFKKIKSIGKAGDKRIQSSKTRNDPATKLSRVIDPEGDPTSLF